MTSRQSVADAAARLATTYDPYTRYDLTTIRHFLLTISQGVRPGADPIIDIGAGTCEPSRILVELGHRVVAADISHDMLTQADRLSRGLWRVTADAVALPIVESSQSGAVFVESLHLIPDFKRALLEARRVVRAGGILAIIDTLREDLELQVFHRYFPEFLEIDKPRHRSLKELIQTAAEMSLVVCYVESRKFRLDFSSLSELMAFVATRPFFGLREMPDLEFAQGLARFKARVEAVYGLNPVTSYARSTCVIMEVPD